MGLDIRLFSPEEWARRSASLVQDALLRVCHRQNRCTVMLTGGRSAECLYRAWRKIPTFDQLRSVTFFFGDERCVLPNDPASNYGLAMRTLFARGVPPGCSVVRMEGDDPDREGACLRYESQLPSKIDILLLGVGEDGHIASLFPGGGVIGERTRKVVAVDGEKEPRGRLTVTPAVIENSLSVFVLADGEAKAAVLRRVVAAADDCIALPACLVREAAWLIDTAF